MILSLRTEGSEQCIDSERIMPLVFVAGVIILASTGGATFAVRSESGEERISQ
jgi:hypothetical protein